MRTDNLSITRYQWLSVNIMEKSDENSDQIVPEWELGNEREHNFGCFAPSCDANANADARRQTCELPLTQKVELENVHSLALIFALTLSYEPEQGKCKLKVRLPAPHHTTKIDVETNMASAALAI